ncbi:ABC transporter permease [Catellatospora tritici]|uniref:ABC transporter permease n=1 Tax=Catellatospora tritici TaxID=2851566 RepID=UPI001C2D1F6C|nr:ABC transporter permease [Catellatospora tritici]MBV1849447.1 ABC transporter permease [Catellatospora tritici]MBV1854019.1 ABC transporter permease [Catellatospora tritici]
MNKLVRMEARLFLRDPAAVIFGILLTPLILVILGSIPGFRQADPALGGHRVIDLYVPILIAMALGMIALNMLPAQLVTYRERGVLRRLSVTPARPRDLLAAQLLVHLVLMAFGTAVLLALGRLAFGVALPDDLVAFTVALVLSAAALFGIGLLVAAAVPGVKVAQGIGSVLFFPILFFGGLWVPREVMPSGLRHVSDLTPLGAGVQAMADAAAGHWPQPLHLAVLAGYVLATWVLAIRLFRWQ